MTHHRIRTASLIALTALCGGVGAETPSSVAVSYEGDPARYIDARLDRVGGDEARQRVRDALQRHLQALGAEHLPEGQQLDIAILDIDLAGRFEPWHFHLHDTRIMRDITWPSIQLRYTLRGPDGEIRSGEETVTDMDYLRHSGFLPEHDRLRYEKRMLADWFRKRFGQRTPAESAEAV